MWLQFNTKFLFLFLTLLAVIAEVSADVFFKKWANSNLTLSLISTGSGDSGNINIDSGRSIILRNNSVIETDAGGSGNGGNVEINTPFLIGLPGENSDIIANAIAGNGGQIQITAQTLLNFQQQDGQNRDLLRNNRSNDISASSETGTDGTITLNIPDINPANNLTDLPTDLVDASNLIEQKICSGSNRSEFVVTGRGGLPEAPTDTMSSLPIWEDDAIAPSPSSHGIAPPRSPAAPIEAQTWRKTPSGKITLYVREPGAIAPLSSSSCQQIREVIQHG